MREEVVHVVPAGIRTVFVRDSFRSQLLVERGRALLESKIVALPAVEVNRSCLQCSFVLAGQSERIVRAPVSYVDRIANEWREGVPSIRSALLSQRVQLFRSFKN